MPAKRKLTKKQILAGFGGSRRKQLAKPGAAHRKLASGKRSKAAPRRRTTTVKRRSVSKKTTTTTSGMSTVEKALIVAGIVAVVGISAAEVNNFVNAHGGWSAAFAAWRADGLNGLLAFASTSPSGVATLTNPSNTSGAVASIPQLGKTALPPQLGTIKLPPGGIGPIFQPGGPGGEYQIPAELIPEDPGQHFQGRDIGIVDPDTGIVTVGTGGNDVHYFDENGNLIM